VWSCCTSTSNKEHRHGQVTIRSRASLDRPDPLMHRTLPRQDTSERLDLRSCAARLAAAVQGGPMSRRLFRRYISHVVMLDVIVKLVKREFTYNSSNNNNIWRRDSHNSTEPECLAESESAFLLRLYNTKLKRKPKKKPSALPPRVFHQQASSSQCVQPRMFFLNFLHSTMRSTLRAVLQP